MSKCGIPYVINEDGSPGQVVQAVRGCSEKSRGCGDASGGGCYAAYLAVGRLKRQPLYEGLARSTATGARWTGEVRLFREELSKPLRRRKPATWFVADMGDICHKKVPDGFLLHVFRMMARAHTQRFLLLTKRPERLADWLAKWADAHTGEPMEFQGADGPEATRAAHPSPRGQMFAEYLELMGEPPKGSAYPTFDWSQGMRGWPSYWFLPNVWLGVSAEGRKEFLERVPQLLRLPIKCAGFWLSAEPQIEDLGDVMKYLAPAVESGSCRPGLSWVVQGCESGPRRRPFDPAWAVSLQQQCELANLKPGNTVAYFYKQAPAPGGGIDKLPKLHGRTWRDVPWRRA